MNRKLFLRPLVVLWMALATLVVSAGLPRSATNRQGVGSEALMQLINDLRSQPFTELHHLVVVKNGNIITEIHAAPYRATDTHNQFSASKMLTALAVGLAVQDEKLSLDDKLGDISVRHLLTMTSGKQVNTQIRDTSDDWMKSWLALPGTAPGKKFAYDTMSAFILSAFVQRATGCTMLDFLRERIFQPMGITDVEWELSPDGINTGGWGVRCSTLSMAMLGQLVLQRGQWNGKQLIDAQWIDMMIQDQLPSLGIIPSHRDDYNHGYGFQMWLNAYPGTVRAQGNFGQLVYIVPADSLVIAVNAAATDQLAILRVVQRDAPLLSSRKATNLPLLNNLLALPLPQGKCWSQDSDTLLVTLASNKHGIQSLELRRDSTCAWLDICRDDGTSERISLGCNHWEYGRLAGTPPYNIGAKNRFSGMDKGFSVAGAYAWTMGHQLIIQLHYVDWYSALSILIDLHRGVATLTSNTSANRPEIVTCSVDVNDQQTTFHACRTAWIAGCVALLVILFVIAMGFAVRCMIGKE